MSERKKFFFEELDYVDDDVDTFPEIESLLYSDIKGKTVIFDIDQSLLLHYAKNQGGNEVRFIKSKHNLFTKRVYDVASNVPNLTIMLVTARPDTPISREITRKELERLEYTNYDCIFFRKITQHDFQKYKTDVRVKIESMNKKILLNIGDKWSDVNGGHSMYKIKLPHVPSKNFWSY